MPDAAWKQFERTVATRFNSHRVPLSGSNSRHETTADVLNDTFYIECKHGQYRMIETIYNVMNGVRALYLSTYPGAQDEERVFVWQMNNERIYVGTALSEPNVYTRKTIGVVNLFRQEVVPQAQKEKRIPLLALHKKGSHTWYLCMRESDCTKVLAYLDEST